MTGSGKSRKAKQPAALTLQRLPSDSAEAERQPLASPSTSPTRQRVVLSLQTLPLESSARFSDVSLLDPPRTPNLTAISSDFATNALLPRTQKAHSQNAQASSSSSTGRPPPPPSMSHLPTKPSPWHLHKKIAQPFRSHSESEIHLVDSATPNGTSSPQQSRHASPVRENGNGHAVGNTPAESTASKDIGGRESGFERSDSDLGSVLIGQPSAEGLATSAYGKSEDMGNKGCRGDSPSHSRLQRLLCGDLLLTATLMGVLAGIVVGLLIRLTDPSPQAIEVLALPGDIMLRLLKMLVLPLVAGSMIAGVCALRGSTMGMARVARYTLLYYSVTTTISVIIGIVLVVIVQPGRGEPLNNSSAAGCRGQSMQEPPTPSSANRASALTAFLGVTRTMFPDNVVKAAVDMNILGVITFALFFGLCLSQLGPEADGLVAGIQAFNTVISKMVTAVLWTSPLGVASLIAAALCRSCQLAATAAALALWVLVVSPVLSSIIRICRHHCICATTCRSARLTLGDAGIAGLGGLVLPGILALTTRGARSPLRAAAGFSRALTLAFATSSSSAALPAAMQCAQDMGCEESVVQFVLPLGTTVNMNGTALYEAVTVIFIAQAHGVPMGLPQLLVVACTATLAAIGAAAIPSAGLVTMLMVLQAVNLDQFAGDLAVILAIDWLLDRCRTAINLLGDSYGVLIVDHLVKHHAPPRSGQASYQNLELV